MSADITGIMEKADIIERSTRAMVEAVTISRNLRGLNEDGILGADRTCVHMTQKAFEAIPWYEPIACKPHSPGWTRHYVFADGVEVFCLVEAIEDADKSV